MPTGATAHRARRASKVKVRPRVAPQFARPAIAGFVPIPGLERTLEVPQRVGIVAT